MFAMVIGMEYPKVIQVGLTVEQHRALRMKSFDEGRSMCALVRDWVEGGCVVYGGVEVKPTKPIKVPVSPIPVVSEPVSHEVPRKATIEEQVDLMVGSERVAHKAKFKPVEEFTDEVKMSKCRYCSEPFPVADMVTEPKSGKLYCANCVQNMKNGQ